MRKILFILVSCLGFICSHAQEYSLTSEGVDNNGNNVVRIVVSTKNKIKTVDDLVKQYAVHGVIFRGIAAAKDYSGQPPIVKDPSVEQSKKVWFDAFWREGGYKQFATVTPSSVSVMKNKQTKMIETSALVVVSSTLLKSYLEKEGVIQGLSNLW